MFRPFLVAASLLASAPLSFSLPSAGASTLRHVSVRPPSVLARPSTVRSRGNIPEPTECTTSSSGFVGNNASGSGNISGGTYSAVLGGQENSACGQGSAVGGGFGNFINGQGQLGGFVGGGEDDVIDGSYDFIGAGIAATIDSGGAGSFIGGGDNAYVVAQGTFPSVAGNQISNNDSFVGAGNLNDVSGNSSFIGAGGYAYATSSGKPTAPGNTISGNDSFIGAGDQNVVSANSAFVGSGSINTIDATGTSATILGGSRNRVSGEYASVLGGFGNLASGPYAIVAGGDADTAAGTVSFAAGYHADASHNGSFVWSDYSSGSASVKDTAINQFVVRASGGTYVYSNEGATTGVRLAAGSGTWSSLSDRNVKTDVTPADDTSVLAKLVALPIETWRYKTENGVRHIGPMAQDFYAAFGVGEDDRHITSIDEDGAALAAIKALHRENISLRARMQAQIDRLAAQNDALERRLDALAARSR